RALRAQPAPDPDLLVDHYLGGGDLPQAAEFAIHAAARAAEALAFDRAAERYGLALELRGDDPDRWSLHARRAEALANAGRGAEAAVSFQSAATDLSALVP